jgi:hypothetical protein
MGFLLLTVLDYKWINGEKIAGLSPLLSVLTLSIAYPIGVFIDNWVGKSLVKRLSGKRRAQYITDGFSVGLVVQTRLNSSWLASYLDNRYSRIRLSRSSAINFLLIAITAPVFVLTRVGGDQALPIALVVCLLSLTVVFLASFSWSKLTDKFYREMQLAKVLAMQADTDLFDKINRDLQYTIKHSNQAESKENPTTDTSL